MSAGYYRFPTIHDDKLVFVSEDDLWTTSNAGGVARRLTSNLGSITFPMLSPDGEWLAFVGREEGTAEVYVMPAVGGSARRLTYLSSTCRVVGWRPGSKEIIFCSNYGQVIQNEFALFTVAHDSENGTVTELPYGPARTITYGPDGGVILGRNTQDSSRWKRYRGGTAGHLWIDRAGHGDFTRFLDNLPGNVAAPMWIKLPTTTGDNTVTAERIFFVSDHEGIGNLYSCTVAGEQLRRHTDHEDYYVRNPSTDGTQIVYQVGADLFRYDLAADREQLLPITYYSPRVQRNRRFVDATRFLEDAALHPDGKSLALATRGKAFAFYNHEGPVLQYGARNGVRYRLPEWTIDGHHIVMISDEIGEETIEIHPTNPQGAIRRLQGLDIGRAVAMKLSPIADIVAIANHRHELLLVDLKTEQLTIVDHSEHGLIAGFDWSPDGRWLTYGYAVSSKLTAIRLYRLADPTAKEAALQVSATHTITQPILRDVNPAFDPEGKYLYFLSYREFNPVYDNLHFELGFPWGMRPYLITLRAELPNPFIPFPGAEGDDDDEADDEAEEEAAEEDEEDEDEGSAAEDEGDDGDENDLPANLSDDEDGEADGEGDDDGAADGEEGENIWPRRQGMLKLRSTVAAVAAVADKEDAAAPTPTSAGKRPKIKRLRIDLEGIERRVLAFPVPDGRYGQIGGVAGKALFTVLPIEGALDDGNEWDDELPETGTLRSYNFKEFKTETLAENVAWFQLARNHKRLLYSGRRRLRVIAAGEKPQSESGPGRRTGWIDLNRIKVSIDPQREWEQMFREAWRLQRDHFWTADMSQVDWAQIYQRYFPLIERVSTRGEFSDLMWEMQGELGTSHAYEYGGDYRFQPYYGQGFLGTAFTWDAQAAGYRVGELLIGDPWQPSSSSPLAAPGVDVQPGDLLIAINGQTLDAQTSPAHLLVNQAGQDILLTFAARPVAAPQPAATDQANGPATPTADEPTDDIDKQPSDQDEQSESVAAEAPATIFEATVTPITTAVPTTDAPTTGADATTIASAPPPAARSVIVRAIHEENTVRYRRWVEANRRFVHEATAGRTGYVHIPDMGPRGYAEFHRGYLAEVDCDALIVDVRYNAGGHVSQLILEKLARRRLGYDISRWGGLDPYPADSMAGPLVAITNEHAGSDGDIFCHSFKLMKLGPLIGKRTWGGVVGISPRHVLVDGTITTQPEFSFWFEDVGWNLENYGTEPDIEVDIRPQDYRQQQDPQLQRAVDEVLRLLAAHPITKPDLATRPSRALPQLPPRLPQ